MNTDYRARIDAIIARHPRLFPSGDRQRGIECPPGWMNIVERMCADIDAMTRDDVSAPTIACVKEKFGCLRVAGLMMREDVHAVADRAEVESARICQDCGAPGRLRYGSWLRTLCEQHAAERGQL